MKGSEIDICLEDMNKWNPTGNRCDVMEINALSSGVLSLNMELRKKMSEKMNDSWNVEIYASEDMRVLAVHPNNQCGFRYPKSGRRKFVSYINNLEEKGYRIPAKYNVEWNEKMQSWGGVLQEVAECPRVQKRRKKSEK